MTKRNRQRRKSREHTSMLSGIASVLFVVVFLKYSPDIAGALEALGAHDAIVFFGSFLIPAFLAIAVVLIADRLISRLIDRLRR